MTLMLISFNHSNELIIRHETKSSLPQQKQFKSACGYAFESFKFTKQKIVCFWNYRFKKRKQKNGPGLAF